ncbi:MAG: cupin domain-containing protein [Crocosphaera sp.]
MKSLSFSFLGSLMLTLAMGSVAKASTIVPPPVPDVLMDYIEMAETGTLPDPLDPNKLVLWSGGGERFTFLERAEDNGGEFSLFDVYVPSGYGPPVHFHTREHEWFYVAEGNAFIQIGDELYAGEPGTLVYGPATIIHAFRNKNPDPARMLLYYAPVSPGDPESVGNIERFFIDVGQEVVDPYNPPQLDIPRLLRVGSLEYGFTFPKTFGFIESEYTGNEIGIRRTGIPNEAGSVVLDLGNGTEIPVDFGIGDVYKTVFLPSDVRRGNLNLSLTNPSEGSLVGLIDETAVRIDVPESSSPMGVLGFGLLGIYWMFRSKQGLKSNKDQLSEQEFSEPATSSIH